MLPDPLLIFIVLAPGIAAAIAGLFQRFIGDRAAMVITTATVGTAGILSLYHLFAYAFGSHEGGSHAHVIELARWMDIGQFQANWAIRVDAMSIVMMAVITSVSGLVHLYSWGYMSEDPHKARFFSYLSLFTFTMLMLVTADNLIQLFFGWEGVGLASYLLIGFWYHKDSANSASIKAFVTNRVGDFGLALGIMAAFFVFGTVEIGPMLDAIKANSFDIENVSPIVVFPDGTTPRSAALAFAGFDIPALEIIGFLLFIGAMGKSAQFLLHVWLPDAMEGPTPVSALIHAATMVTAGVYLVCLMSPVYEYAPWSSGFIALVGAVTALYAATVGLAQNDIKRVIAFSTCSQLGYMFFAAGVGAYQAAMFHLFTHAFFKALLFLGAGSVIHGMHHEQDMRKMGGVASYMKITYAAMLIGTIAIIGLGIPHTQIGFAGFFSKDAIIETAFAAGVKGVSMAQLAFWFGIIAALLTSFYSWRLIYMTFHGPMYEAPSHDHHDDEDDHHGHHHAGKPHESPWIMLIPLIVLSIGAVTAGFAFYDSFVGHHYKEFWDGAIYSAKENTVLKDKYLVEKGGLVPEWVFWVPLFVTVLGFLIATFTYLFNRGVGQRVAASGGPLHALFSNKWYFDEIYNATLVKGTRGLGDFFWKVGDKKIIDGLGPDGLTGLAKWTSARLSAMHTGYLYHYAFVILGAAAVFGAVMLINITGAN